MRVVGKGNRERLIPFGEEAVKWLQQFMQGPRVEILLERQTDYLFPTRRGDRMTRQAFWHIIKRYSKKAGVEKIIAAYLAARLRDAPVESRRGSARGADAARSQRSVDDPDLHARCPRALEGPALPASSARLTEFAGRLQVPGLLELAEPRTCGLRGRTLSVSVELCMFKDSFRRCLPARACCFAPRFRACVHLSRRCDRRSSAAAADPRVALLKLLPAGSKLEDLRPSPIPASTNSCRTPTSAT
jgi:hypothetical protein